MQKIREYKGIVMVVLVILLAISLFFNLKTIDKMGGLVFPDPEPQKRKCFSWSVYDPLVGAWHWRSENLNEFFPTRDDAIANCLAMFSVLNLK